MSRSLPWRGNCPQSVKDILERLNSCQLLLVKRIGPTSFLLSGSEGREKFKTSIGDPHHCSCSIKREICLHVIFILRKVFFLPKENPLVWQRSLVEAEIDELLRAENRVKNVQKHVGVMSRNALPRELEEGDVCPICFEELGNETSLSYCQGGCGKYIHSHCFKQYMRYNTGNNLRCPFCRSLWINNPNVKSKKCSGCKKYINGQSYRCLFCQEYLLCTNCFHQSDVHLNHPFSILGSSGIEERNINRGSRAIQINHEPPSNNISAEVLPLMYRDIEPNDYDTLLQLDERNNRNVLTNEEFMKLKRTNWNISMGIENCHICLESYDSTSTCVWLLCGHFFHLSCAKEWLTEHAAKCPLDHLPVIVSNIQNPVVEVNSSSSLPALRHRDHVLHRQRNEPNTTTRILRRRPHSIHPRIEGQRVIGTTSLPHLELQVLPLGLVQRPRRNNDNFYYGSI